MNHLCLVGDWARRDPLHLRTGLQQLFPGRGWNLARNLAELESLVNAGPSTITESSLEMIVVLQWLPYEYSASEIDRLFERFPLSKIVCGLSPWCAADRRSRAIWPAAATCFLHELYNRIQLEVDSCETGIPVLAASDEQVLAEAQARERCWLAARNNVSATRGSVAIITADHAFGATLLAVLQASGLTAQVLPPWNIHQLQRAHASGASDRLPAPAPQAILVDDAVRHCPSLVADLIRIPHQPRLIWLTACQTLITSEAPFARPVPLANEARWVSNMATPAELLSAIVDR